jgi:hypothetical protein
MIDDRMMGGAKGRAIIKIPDLEKPKTSFYRTDPFDGLSLRR